MPDDRSSSTSPSDSAEPSRSPSDASGNKSTPRPFSDPSGRDTRSSGSAVPRESSQSSVDRSASSQAPEPPPTPITQQIGRVVVVLLAVAFGVFAVVNAQFVEFSWLFGETRVMLDDAGERVSGGVPLIVLLVASLVIGIAVGMLVSWQRSRTRRQQTKSDNAARGDGKRDRPSSAGRS